MSQTILVTGANKGLGYEAVKLLSIQKPESTILLASRSIQNGNDAIEKMKSSNPSYPFTNIKVLELDVTSPSSLSAAAVHIKSTYQTLDHLIHNSGIFGLDGNDKHPAIFDVNVRGAKDCIETFLPLFPAHSGKITVVSSQVGAWYTHSLEGNIRKDLNDIDSVSWDKVEGWMQDYEKFANEKESKEKWVPFDQGLAGSMYGASKAFLNAYLRNFAITHKEVKLAVVCPGESSLPMSYCQG
jgi:NAD(P)-dependent dehydrogenase (short-subunit alcohol dehydrogenase family)